MKLSDIPVEFTKSELDASTILDKQTFVKLQSNDKTANIERIERVLCADNLLFIVDKVNNQVISFDYEGNYVNSTTDLIGKAPNEYLQLTDASIDESNREIYVYCDTPSQMLILDYDLKVKECVPMKDLLWEIAVDSDYLYALCPDLTDESKYDVRCYRKDNLTDAPTILIKQEKAIPETRIVGCSLSKNGNFIYVSLPFDNVIYKIADGKVIQDWKFDMGDRWFDYHKSKGLNGWDFFKVNKDNYWMILNITASDNEILFNTNQPGILDLSLDNDECIGYFSFQGKLISFSISSLLSTSGRYDFSFSIPAAALVRYNDYYKDRKFPFPDNILNPIIQSAKMGDNPLIVLGKLK